MFRESSISASISSSSCSLFASSTDQQLDTARHQDGDETARQDGCQTESSHPSTYLSTMHTFTGTCRQRLFKHEIRHCPACCSNSQSRPKAGRSPPATSAGEQRILRARDIVRCVRDESRALYRCQPTPPDELQTKTPVVHLDSHISQYERSADVAQSGMCVLHAQKDNSSFISHNDLHHLTEAEPKPSPPSDNSGHPLTPRRT